MREDKEALEAVLTIHEARTDGGYGLGVFKDDLKAKLGDDK
jgi:methyl-coenzyme M reductase gamma subunit